MGIGACVCVLGVGLIMKNAEGHRNHLFCDRTYIITIKHEEQYHIHSFITLSSFNHCGQKVLTRKGEETHVLSGKQTGIRATRKRQHCKCEPQ